MKNKLEDVTNEEFQEALDTSRSYHSLIKKFNLAVNGTSYELLKKEIKERNLDTTKFEKLGKLFSRSSDYTYEEVFCKDSPTNNIKKYIIKYNVKDISRCEVCGIDSWMGYPIIIQIHHKDGDHHNNELDNLQALCPNCHSQTKNFGSKNTKKIASFKKNEGKKCIDCGEPVYGDNNRCSSCYIKWEEKISKFPNKKQLEKYVNNVIDFNVLTAIYNVEEKEIISWLEKYNLLEKYYNNKKLKAEKEVLKELKKKQSIEKEERRKLREQEKEKKLLQQKNKQKVLFAGNGLKLFSPEEVEKFRQELKPKIRKKSFLAISKEYNVTDNAIRKWCKHLNLPYKKREIDKISDEEWEKI